MNTASFVIGKKLHAFTEREEIVESVCCVYLPDEKPGPEAPAGTTGLLAVDLVAHHRQR